VRSISITRGILLGTQSSGNPESEAPKTSFVRSNSRISLQICGMLTKLWAYFHQCLLVSQSFLSLYPSAFILLPCVFWLPNPYWPIISILDQIFSLSTLLREMSNSENITSLVSHTLRGFFQTLAGLCRSVPVISRAGAVSLEVLEDLQVLFFIIALVTSLTLACRNHESTSFLLCPESSSPMAMVPVL
jgi:hypothetical protein